jgi:hypothetical protein
MTKKILLLIGILIIIALAVFWVLNRGASTQNPDGTVGFSIRDFLPFGSNNNTVQIDTSSSTPDVVDNTPNTTNTNTPVPKLRKLSIEPVAGAVVFNRGTSTIVRFVEKGTGNVYEANGSTNQITRLTNTTIPKIIRATWLPDGSGFLAQTIDAYTEVIETSLVNIVNSKTSTSTENLTPFRASISKLPIGINEIIVRPDSKKIVYYIVNPNGSSWYISNPDGTQASKIIDMSVSEWIPRSYINNKVIIQTKSSYSSAANTYVLDTEARSIKKTGASIVGLSAIPDYDQKPYLISKGGQIPALGIMNDVSGTTVELKTFGLADKCVWSKSKDVAVICAVPNSIPLGLYPDDWYKGKISTTDTVRKIDYVNGIQTNISDLSADSNEKIDVVNPQVSKDDSYLIFRNKIDGYLWMLNLNS